MRKFLLLMLLPVASSSIGQNVDTLLYERFETGGSSFVLNSTDAGGVSGTTGYNQWIINNAYTGGNGQLVCLGFPFNFTIPNTPQQPAMQTGSVTSNYLHIVSDAGQASAIQNCCFQAADGICSQDEINFSAMTSDLVTTGYDSVTVSFLWICSGGTNIYGEFYYSMSGGNFWTAVTTPISQYKNQSNWVQQSVTIPTFAGQTALRFGFRFVNQSSTTATEPGFGIDEFLVVGKNASPAPVAAFAVSDDELCQSGCVNFTDQSTGSPTSWLWIFQGAATSFSTQQNPQQICYNSPGTYDVTLIVTSAAGTDTLTNSTVIVHPDPLAPVITLSGDTLFATPGFPGYQWSLNGVEINGATNDSYVVLMDGGYTVTITDSNGCTAFSNILNYTTGITEYNNSQLHIYPNPSTGIFYFGNLKEFQRVEIIDIIGKTVLEIFPDYSTYQLNLEKQLAGIYFVEAIRINGSAYVTKLIKY